MSTIIIDAVLATGLLIALATPLWALAWRNERKTTARNFLYGAGAVGLLVGFLAGASERQVQQCLEAGNSDCVDSGSIGLRLLFLILYVVAAWSAAYFIWRD